MNELEKYQAGNKIIKTVGDNPSFIIVPGIILLIIFIMNPWLVAVAGAAGIGGVALGRASK